MGPDLFWDSDLAAGATQLVLQLILTAASGVVPWTQQFRRPHVVRDLEIPRGASCRLQSLGIPAARAVIPYRRLAADGAGGLSQLSVKLIKAGVSPERIAPGKPQQNGRHERMHLTLLQDVANPPAHSMREQLKRLRRFQQLYNEERPHQALDNATPAERYQVSPRHFDGILRSPEYGDQEVRWVRHNGEIKLDGKFIYINSALTGEPVGLAESEHGWTVTYGPIMRHHRPSKRRITKTKEGPWTWGQRCALPPGPQPQHQQT